MSYKAGIITAITELKDRTGSSSIAIKKHMQANVPSGKKWLNATFLKALKTMVVAGDLNQTKSSYRLSPDFKKKVVLLIGFQTGGGDVQVPSLLLHCPCAAKTVC